jgi:hypothetical protein
MVLLILMLLIVVPAAAALHYFKKHEDLILRTKIAKVENRTRKWETKLKTARLSRLGQVEIAKLPSHHIGVMDYGNFDRKIPEGPRPKVRQR